MLKINCLNFLYIILKENLILNGIKEGNFVIIEINDFLKQCMKLEIEEEMIFLLL